MLIKRSPEKFYRPPYVGPAGWVGIELPKVSDEELALHLGEAWRLIAPPKLQAEVAARKGEAEGPVVTSGKKVPAKVQSRKAKPGTKKVDQTSR